MNSIRAARLSSIPPSNVVRIRAIRGPIVLFASLVALAALLFVRGADFYRLDLVARVDHPDFRVLSPGSPVGHGYGVVGTLMVLTNLLYLARRRFARFQVGSMKAWLNMHVVTGLFGSVLIVYHSAFQLRSPIASLTAFALGLVVVSGIVGRYFYSLSPKAHAAELNDQLAVIDVFDEQIGAAVAEALRNYPPPREPRRGGLIGSLATGPAWIANGRARKARIRALLAPLFHASDLGRDELQYLRGAARQLERAATQPVRTAAGASLLRTWRGLHRFMALLMIVSVTVHIAVAWVFGYRWIFE